jgi:hypothetical protein
MGGNNDLIKKLFPPRESLVNDILGGDGIIKKLFYGFSYCTLMESYKLKVSYCYMHTKEEDNPVYHPYIEVY